MNPRRLVTLALLSAPCIAEAQNKALAVFSGIVVDTAQRPLANAEIAMTALNLKVTSNDRGEFRIKDVPAGIHGVTVRRIGYASLDTNLIFADGQTLERRVILGARVVQLDSVVAVDRARDPILADFEANKARGFGRFLDADQLAKMSVRPLGLAVQTMSGLDVLRGHSSQGWISGKNAMPTHCPRSTGVSSTNPNANGAAAAREMQAAVDDCLRRERIYYVPDPTEEAQGIKRNCYAVVYVDRHIMNSGRPTPPFDLNEFVAQDLIGFEWYADNAQVPPMYDNHDAQCGVAVLHLRKAK